MPEFKFPEALILVNNRRHRTLPWLEIGRKYRWPGAVNPYPCLAWLALVLLLLSIAMLYSVPGQFSVQRIEPILN